MNTNPQLWPPLAEVGSRSNWCLEEEENRIIMVADGNAAQLPVPGEQEITRMGAGTSWVCQLSSADDNPSQCVPLTPLMEVPPSDGLEVPTQGSRPWRCCQLRCFSSVLFSFQGLSTYPLSPKGQLCPYSCYLVLSRCK